MKSVRFKGIALTAIAAAMGFAGMAHAKPFEPSSVAADAKWVIHVDVDAVAKTNLWKLIQPKLNANPNFTKAKATVERISQARLPDDLHDVTIYGPSFGEQEAVIILRATANHERLKTLLSLNETYTTQVMSGQTIHSWEDKGRQLYGGFDNDRIVVGRSAERVAQTLELLTGKGDPIRDGNLLPPGAANAGVLAYVAGDQIAELAKVGARSPVLKQLESAWFTVSENAKGLSLTSQVTAQSEKIAEDATRAIEGVKAMVSFAGQDDPDALLVSEALLDLHATAEGKLVKVEWEVPTQTISDLIERATGAIEKRAPVTR